MPRFSLSSSARVLRQGRSGGLLGVGYGICILFGSAGCIPLYPIPLEFKSVNQPPSILKFIPSETADGRLFSIEAGSEDSVWASVLVADENDLPKVSFIWELASRNNGRILTDATLITDNNFAWVASQINLTPEDVRPFRNEGTLTCTVSDGFNEQAPPIVWTIDYIEEEEQ